MPNFHRWRVPGATYFVRVVTADRRPLFWNDRAREYLRAAIRDCRKEWDFSLDAIVLLPDHWHALFTLPPQDDGYSMRLGWIKKEFSKGWLAAGGSEVTVSHSKSSQRRRGVWQTRFWEHTIRDDDDFEAHMDYIHFNPVKHGYAATPADWEWSSFHRWVEAGAYSQDWGTGFVTPPIGGAVRDFRE